MAARGPAASPIGTTHGPAACAERRERPAEPGSARREPAAAGGLSG
jgi:hypothetical protein